MTEQLRRELSIKEIDPNDVETGSEDGAPLTSPFVYPSVLDIEVLMVGTNGKVIQLRTAAEASNSACKWDRVNGKQPARSQRLKILANFAATGLVALSVRVWCNLDSSER